MEDLARDQLPEKPPLGVWTWQTFYRSWEVFRCARDPNGTRQLLGGKPAAVLHFAGDFGQFRRG